MKAEGKTSSVKQEEMMNSYMTLTTLTKLKAPKLKPPKGLDKLVKRYCSLNKWLICVIAVYILLYDLQSLLSEQQTDALSFC